MKAKQEQRLSEALRIVEEIQQLLARAGELEGEKLGCKECEELQRLRARLCEKAAQLEKVEAELARHTASG